jgi:DNA replicative helicase MCM subunit Mcm2 (Cdc46/Mcm family)
LSHTFIKFWNSKKRQIKKEAKMTKTPILTEKAVYVLKNFYVQTRQKQDNANWIAGNPLSGKLLTLDELKDIKKQATNLAKARGSSKVLVEDVRKAIRKKNRT